MTVSTNPASEPQGLSFRYHNLVRRLSQLIDDRQRREYFEVNTELCSVSVVKRLANEVAHLVRVDLQQAERLSATVKWLAEEIDDDYCRGLSYRARANIFYLRCEYKAALACYETAFESFERLGEQQQAAITSSSALHTLVLLGKYERATAWAQRARETFETLGDRLRLARLEGNLANILFRQDRWQEAAGRYRAAHEEFLLIGEAQDVAICLRNMAVCHASLNKFQEALELYEQARDYCEQNRLAGLVGEVDYNIAYLHYLRGEYTLAIQLYRNTRAKCEELGDRYHSALCDLDQSEIFLELNLVGEAGGLAQQALTSFDQIGMRYEAAKALTFLAISRGREGKAFLALDLLGKARQIFVQERNEVWPALIDLYEALVLYGAGRPLEAFRLAQRALEGFSVSPLPTKVMMCEVLLARLHLANGKHLEARELCASVLAKLQAMDVPTLKYQTCLVLGQVEEAMGETRVALATYRRAQASLERLRNHVRAEELKIGFLEDKLSVYESLVALTLQHGFTAADNEASLAYIERAKSRSLADLMAFRAHAVPPTTATRSDQAEQIRKLREELNWYYRQIDLQEMSTDYRSREEVQQLRQISRRREDRLLRTLRELEDQEFSSLQQAATVNLEAIQSSIPENTQLLEYYIARGVVYACVLSREELHVVPLTISSRVRELHRLLQFQLSKFRLGASYVAEFSGLIAEATGVQLRALYEELLAPIHEYLIRERLVIVPHDYLHNLPFHALFDGSRFMMDRFVISYAPSATVYYLCRSKDVRSEGETLIIGAADPAMSHFAEQVRAAVGAFPGARVLVGEEASGEALKLYGASSRILFLMIRGRFRSDNPMFSALQFSDTELSLFDLYSLRLAAEIVVLCGCGSGLQGGDNGDGLIGLIRGVLYAGARSVITSLWEVEDESNLFFMRCLCKSISEGSDKGDALRDAVREVRARFPHPYQWAPYVLSGEPTLGI